jgi:hypothetical protein
MDNREAQLPNYFSPNRLNQERGRPSNTGVSGAGYVDLTYPRNNALLCSTPP